MIAFESVVARYRGASVAALDGVSFQVPSGAVTAVVGPNGSGKSTLVRTLLGRAPVTAGRVRIDGGDAAALDRLALARRVAVVPQRESPSFPVAVRDYVALGRYPHLGAWRAPGAADEAAVADAVRRADVAPLLARGTDELSGGEWQRVRLARALAQGAAALVLDEPSTFLDIAHEMALFELLDDLAREGRAVLLVSHQVNLVARFAQAIVLLDHGRVAAAGTPADVMRAEVLERVYEWPLVVTRDPAVGAPALVPLRGGRR
ncbi:MAG TPA: ABC transporter ATP-binding protein [Gemmatimonadaceae bacterium]|nr:ABC transporter ATP-binding protein [Gemmatimonadaceae bacterium]